MPQIVNQIKDLVNDSVEDALGKQATLNDLDTTDLVSLGKALSQFNAYEKFYGALANRIVKTVYFVRTYQAKTRSVLRDESEFGAFVQKVYTEMDEATDNPAFAVTTIDPSTGARTYSQASPYDVENVIKVSAIIYSGQGTWSKEFIYSLEEIKTAFTSNAAMMQLIDAIYTTADNSMKLEIERIEAAAVNTSIANSIKNGLARNLLEEYNTNHPTATLTRAQALEDLDFLKYASKEISETVDHIQNMSVVFNAKGYETYTPRENLVVEVLSHFAKATASYLEADTYHNDLVSLPKYNSISYWQGSGTSFSFDVCSAINIEHSDIDDDPIEQDGIICFLHDTENVAAYFGDRYTWELPNPRSRVMIHGEQARKGYAIDDHANSFVFYLADPEPEPPVPNKKVEKATK